MDGITYRLIRSRRKTLGIQIASAGEVIIRAPARMPEKEIRRFLEEKRDGYRVPGRSRRLVPGNQDDPGRNGGDRVLPERKR